MKVKVRKHKKSPAPRKTEQVLIEAMVSSSPNLYLATQKAVRDMTNESPPSNHYRKDRMPETAFVDIIDQIYNKVHNPLVKNSSMRYFPDLKISEYVKYFNL